MRKLTDEERALWERLGQSVKPLAKGSRRAVTAKPSASAVSRSEAKPDAPQRSAQAAPPWTPAPALAPLEARARRRLARGAAEVDARIDLHGMRQERAFARLQAFLRMAQAHGYRTVLVVTGKGRADDEERGILRKAVPAWLARPDFRHLVVGFETAHRRHGGEGALYVRVRRRREAGRAAPAKA